MKRAAATLLSSLALTACSTAQSDPAQRVEPGQAFTLAVGATAQLANSDLRIGFTGVSSDSRCPKGTQCVWAGDAIVQLWLRRGDSPQQPLALHTASGPGQSAQVLGQNLRLLGLTPDPVGSRPVQAADYRATLVLTVATRPAER